MKIEGAYIGYSIVLFSIFGMFWGIKPLLMLLLSIFIVIQFCATCVAFDAVDKDRPTKRRQWMPNRDWEFCHFSIIAWIIYIIYVVVGIIGDITVKFFTKTTEIFNEYLTFHIGKK